ncbi:MAG: NAD-dependent epimerase/dehydratase [Chthoniobacteraceae bacterium]|nr:NAD-dependent epimerase/dehydratase [Chthoniobacteraceae bacterium]
MAREFARKEWRILGVDVVPPENAPQGAGYVRLALPSSGFNELLRSQQPDVCIHCAGRASVPLSMNDPASDFRDNTVLTFEILEALRREALACRFLFLSSAAVYGNPESLPVAETHRVAPLSPYGYHKRQCELLCEEFSTIFGLPTAALRIFSAYGPGLRRQVIWDICERVLTTGELRLRGTGRESRDFIHATDIGRALLCIASEAPCRGEIYNVASGREATIQELSSLLLDALGSSTRPRFDGAATPGNPLYWRADIGRIAALGFAPSISLEKGVRSVATWSSAELASV